jgi:hypothetical protein
MNDASLSIYKIMDWSLEVDKVIDGIDIEKDFSFLLLVELGELRAFLKRAINVFVHFHDDLKAVVVGTIAIEGKFFYTHHN